MAKPFGKFVSRVILDLDGTLLNTGRLITYVSFSQLIIFLDDDFVFYLFFFLWNNYFVSKLM